MRTQEELQFKFDELSVEFEQLYKDAKPLRYDDPEYKKLSDRMERNLGEQRAILWAKSDYITY